MYHNTLYGKTDAAPRPDSLLALAVQNVDPKDGRQHQPVLVDMAGVEVVDEESYNDDEVPPSPNIEDYDPEAIKLLYTSQKDDDRERRHSLDNHAMQTLKQFLGNTKEYKNKYILDANEDSRHGASGVVVFATNMISGRRVALKFFLHNEECTIELKYCTLAKSEYVIQVEDMIQPTPQEPQPQDDDASNEQSAAQQDFDVVPITTVPVRLCRGLSTGTVAWCLNARTTPWASSWSRTRGRWTTLRGWQSFIRF